MPQPAASSQLTIKQVLRSLYKFPGGYERIQRVPQVKVTSFKRGYSKSMDLTRFLARTRTPEQLGGRVVMQNYTTMLDFRGPRYAKVSCSCPDFVYTWEWALWKHGNADIVFGNGEPPDSRNPAHLPGCCKHLVALINRMVKEGYLTTDFEIPKVGKKV